MTTTLAEASVLVRLDMSRTQAQAVTGATAAGKAAGDALGTGITRGVDGKMRDAQGRLVTGMHQAGGRAGAAAGGSFGGNFTGTVKNFAGRAAGAVGALTGAVTGVGLAGLVTFGLKSAASLEQAQIGFETLLGSGKKAQSFLTGLQKFAAATPFTLPGLIDASRTLLGVGVNAKQVIPLLTAFGDTAGAVGLGQEQFQRIMIATSQAIGAGKFQTADLNQIMNNGLPVWSILAKAMHKTVPELRDLASHGKLLSKDVLPVLQKQMEKDYGGAMARQSQTLAGVWSTLTDSVAIGLANALKPLVPLLTALIPKAATAASVALRTVSGFIVALISGLQGKAATTGGFVGQLQSLGVAAHNAWPQIKAVALAVGGFLVGAFRIAAPIIATLVGWLARHRAVTLALVGALVALVAIYKVTAAVQEIQKAGLIAYLGLTKAVKVATVLWTGVQWLLNAALTANPIGLVIVALGALVAGLIIAYKHSAAFRAAVSAAWNGVKAVVAAVAGWITGTAVPALVAAWSNISKAAFRMWITYVQPALAAFRAYIAKNVAPTVLSLWQNVVRPAFTAIGAIIGAMWVVVRPILQLLWAFIKNVLIPVLLFLWRNVVAPAFKAIAQIVGFAIRAVIASLTGFLALLRNVVFPGIRLLLTVVTAVFRAVANTIRSVVTGVETVFRGLVNWVTKTLPSAFRTGAAAIGRAWSAVQNAARVPVSFVVNKVINPLIGGYNRVGKVFGVSPVDTIKGFAGGGGIPGHAPHSRADNVLIRATPGEYMQPVPTVDYYGTGVMDAIRQRRIPRQVLSGFADGGLVGGIKSFFSKVTSGFKGVGTVVANPGAALAKLAGAGVAAIPGHGAFHTILAAMARKIIGGISGFLTGKNTASLVGIATRGVISAVGGSLGAWIRQAIALTGVPSTWAGPLGVLIRRESGGNPRAINLTDSNAKAGHPSKGLMQTIPGTFAAYRLHSLPNDIYNPVANIAAGIRYILSRYGSIFNVQQANPNLPPKGYGGGGSIQRIAQVAMADSGRVTLERGWNLVGNGTGGREALSSGGGGGVHFHFHGPVASRQGAQDMVLGAYNDLVRLKKITP